MVRYPHTAQIKVEKSKQYDEKGNLITLPEIIDVICRVEFSGGQDLNGKAYLPYKECQGDIMMRNATLIFQKREYKITSGIKYQTHTELWLD